MITTMVKNFNNISYSGYTDTPVLQYLTRKSVLLNLPFILTENKILTIGMPYMKTENWLADSRTEAVKLLEIYDYEGIVYLKVQSLTTFKVNTLSWVLKNKTGIWLWCITSYSFLEDLSNTN